jgi:hypothetical protein
MAPRDRATRLKKKETNLFKNPRIVKSAITPPIKVKGESWSIALG